MDIKLLLEPFFANAALLLPGPGLVAATLAQLVYAVLKEVGFDPAKAVEQLGRIGFKIGQALLPELIEAAKSGIKGLTKWFEAKLANSPEVNEAASQVLVEQAEPVATAVQEALPEEKDDVAQTMQEGLQAYGGATAEIAEPYAAVLKDLNQLQTLMAEMHQKIDAWASQTVEAKRGSLIENVEQTIEGGAGGKQDIRSTDDSVISGVKQVIRGGPESKSK